jgi:hypothetical protein
MQCFIAILLVDNSPEVSSFLPIPIPTVYTLATNSYVRYLPLNKPAIIVSNFGTQYYGTLMLQNTWQNNNNNNNDNWNGY